MCILLLDFTDGFSAVALSGSTHQNACEPGTLLLPNFLFICNAVIILVFKDITSKLIPALNLSKNLALCGTSHLWFILKQANICLSKMLCTGNKYSKYFLTRGRSIFLNHSTIQFCLSLTATVQAMSMMIPHIVRSDSLAGRKDRGA